MGFTALNTNEKYAQKFTEYLRERQYRDQSAAVQIVFTNLTDTLSPIDRTFLRQTRKKKVQRYQTYLKIGQDV